MNIFDAHCDVIYKIWLDPTILFSNSQKLHITYEQLVESGSKVQCFAIYIPEQVRPESRFEVALEMIDIFYQKVIAPSPFLKVVKTKDDIKALKDREIGAILTLEGCDAIDNSLIKLKTLLRLGVSAVGLTWNYANSVADGILEDRGGGLSCFGKEVVNELNRSCIWTDVSHLSIKGFWDVMELAEYPIASHSNAYTLCNHPRNLNDEQIQCLIKKNGMIGVTFVPQFLRNDEEAVLRDVLKHIDFICALGGEYNLGFGSDFDGITETTYGLERYAKYDALVNCLLNYYSERQVRRFLFENFLEHFPR
ncbi:dipeptidase [Ferdinandcohnia quinoae]|uniref:Dipeptidase n=1 Tax=Fredinandcohnia quinoae TaxID=2918902 RepID=A0AAW5E110_9BACI|nr:dipeptidase [Fredinandcohnia sp. SECRCQ15]MCH1623706.1 dipeptidase [Fredinandcohnia sp. SECRCQ15]